MKTRDFKLKRSDHECVLLDIVAARLEISRKKAKGLLDARAVQVNGRPVWMARHRLRFGDSVRVLLAEEDTVRTVSEANVLHEDADCLVADKPPGLLSCGHGSLESRLRRSRGEAGIRAVHRLDRDTSGCLIFARNAASRDALIEAFRAGRVVKLYHALTWGKRSEPESTIVSEVDGQRAVTRIRRLDARGEAAHWLIRIETGRTHQIRKHLSRQGYPVIGDRQYRGPASSRAFEVSRQMLHAASVAFPHPSASRVIRVSAPLPADFLQAMKRLRLT